MQSTVYHYLTGAYREISYSDGNVWRVNFAGLQRMILATHQKELIELVGRIGKENHEINENLMDKIETTLSKYSR
jgi:hypothetical protein